MDIDKITKMYVLDKKSTYQIGNELGVNPNRIWVTLKKSGVKLRNKKEAFEKYAKRDICVVCKKEFRVREDWLHGNHYRKTCSPECERDYRSKRVKETYTQERKDHMSKVLTGRDTSGWNIPKGEQKWNWKGGHNAHYYRYLAFEVYGMEKQCVVENCKNTDLCVHHKDGNRNNNTRENLEVHCKAHHTGGHSKDNALWKKHLKKKKLQEIT
jgi:hypothetical protein